MGEDAFMRRWTGQGYGCWSNKFNASSLPERRRHERVHTVKTTLIGVWI